MISKKAYSAILVSIYIIAISCNPQVTKLYYYDNTKLDDGEITATYLKGFFVQDKNVHEYAVRSHVLVQELKKIIDSITKIIPTDEFDDGYYGYAFIIPNSDTIFSDYNLSYWRHHQARGSYKNDTLKQNLQQIKSMKNR
jgi:hypothetical protein